MIIIKAPRGCARIDKFKHFLGLAEQLDVNPDNETPGPQHPTV